MIKRLILEENANLNVKFFSETKAQIFFDAEHEGLDSELFLKIKKHKDYDTINSIRFNENEVDELIEYLTTYKKQIVKARKDEKQKNKR